MLNTTSKPPMPPLERNMRELATRLYKAFNIVSPLSPNLEPHITQAEYKQIIRYAYHYIASKRYHLAPDMITNQHLAKCDSLPRACEIVLIDGEYQLMLVVKSLDPKQNKRPEQADMQYGIRLDQAPHDILRVIKRKAMPTVAYLNQLKADQTLDHCKTIWDKAYNEVKFTPLADSRHACQPHIGCMYHKPKQAKATVYLKQGQMTLGDLLRENPNISIEQRIRYFLFSLHSIKGLHQKGIMNMDIKLDNLTVCMDGVKWISLANGIRPETDTHTHQARRVDIHAMLKLGVELIYDIPLQDFSKLPAEYQLKGLKLLDPNNQYDKFTLQNTLMRLSADIMELSRSGLAPQNPSQFLDRALQNKVKP